MSDPTPDQVDDFLRVVDMLMQRDDTRSKCDGEATVQPTVAFLEVYKWLDDVKAVHGGP